MIMIVGHHFVVLGDFNTSVNTLNTVWLELIGTGGKIGVNLFVLISGYFLVTTKSIKISKVLIFWLQIFFYSVVIYAVFCITGSNHFNLKNLIENLFPLTYSKWWFATSYFVLLIFSPYINIILRSFSKKQYLCFISLLVGIFCVILSLSQQIYLCDDIIWFVVLYCVAGYIRLYEKDIRSISKIIKLLIIISTLLLFIVVFLSDSKKAFTIKSFSITTILYDMVSIPIFMISIVIFMAFLKIKIPNNRFINIVSSATFGVYLIHDSDYIRPFIWETVFKNNTFADSNIMIPYSVFVILMVFVCCTIIELLRKYLIEKNYMPLVNKAASFIESKKDRLFSNDKDKK